MGNAVVSPGGTPAAAPATPAASAINLDKVTTLIRKSVVVPAMKDVADQQANLKALTPVAKNPVAHHVSESFIGSVVRNAASGGLINDIIALIVQELLGHFNKPTPPTS